MNDSAQPCVLSVDIGTSSVRAMIFTIHGTILHRTQLTYTTIKPAPLQEEQEPQLVKTKTFLAISESLAFSRKMGISLLGIGFSSQMYGIFPVDGQGKPLGNSILWSESRSIEEANAIKKSSLGKQL